MAAHPDGMLVCLHLHVRLAALDYALHFLGRAQVSAFIKLNGGTDVGGANFLFHFRTYRDLMTCRDAMRTALPHAFYR
jgi:hypothetical protein